MPIHQAVQEAEARIRPHVAQTPLRLSQRLSQATGAAVYLKLENRQHTGSFKLRGATHKLLRLSPRERSRGVVTASTGNHGLAMAHAAAHLGVPAQIFMPQSASPRKVEKLRAFPVTLRFVPGDAVHAETAARQMAEERALPFVSPYNDPDVIAGQGTVAVELLRQQPGLDAVFVAVGGGGLISGIAGYLKQKKPSVQIVGCQPENSAVMLASVRAGRIVELDSQPTLSDGTAGGIEADALTLRPCQQFVDEWLTVREGAIADAMRQVFDETGEIIEGAAGVAVAGLLQAAQSCAGLRVAVVICGGNVDEKITQEILGASR